MKNIAVVSFYSDTTNFYKRLIKDIFKDSVSIRCFSLEEGFLCEKIKGDLIIVTSYHILGAIKNHVNSHCEIIIANCSMTRDALDKLKKIPKKTKALLVNNSPSSSLETISLIYQLGIDNIDLVKYYPEINNVPKLKTAITPNEEKLVPDFVENTINIGDKVLSISTIVDIATKIGLEHILRKPEVRLYFKEVVSTNFFLEKLLEKANQVNNQADLLLGILDEGIISITPKGTIDSFNESAEKIIGLKKENAIGNLVKDVFPQIPFEKIIKTGKPIKETLIKINNKNYIISMVPIYNLNSIYRVVLMVKRFSDVEKKQHKHRKQLLGKGHIAKYDFSDIIGKSSKIRKCKEIAKQMSLCDSSVLITGESGTGKELFAQAIHNNSNRKEYQFVAINCATLPENLLESELFGYEEGAFTGAKKGGKIGLFELAHEGTLFLDEISEVPIKLQARLLRVLQEREVMRIGGDKVIKVDVKVIAATNKPLKNLVNDGKFRKDLYYRLNVLPLRIPPLRERREDIPLLIKSFLYEFKKQLDISYDVIENFIYHHWDGNIRELKNCIEYLIHLNKKRVEIDDVPFYFKEKENFVYNDLTKIEKEIIENFKLNIGNKINKYMFVLKELKISYKNRIRIGRRKIAEKANFNGIFISEQEVRSMLKQLQGSQMVEINPGRGGTVITEFGIKTLEYLEKGLAG
ncbi:MAG: PAS domain-containing protein [Firmicutes bacterium]|nr:PAS domain-containing protein [Bacillota bacterium]